MSRTTSGTKLNLKLDLKNLGLKTNNTFSGLTRTDSKQANENDSSKTDSQSNDTADGASKTDSQPNDTADDASKTDSSDTSKTNSKSKDGKQATRINFTFSDKEHKGLKFEAKKAPSSTKSERAFTSPRIGNSKYDTFLNERISSGANSLKKKDKGKQSSTNPPKLTKKKENVFEVRYIPISGVHFDQIFINKDDVSDDDDQSIGPSFNQSTHISLDFDALYQ